MNNLPFQQNKLLSELCTFGIGGPARYWIEVRQIEEMRQALLCAKKLEIPYLILGKGSNCLFDDRGFHGLVIVNKIDFNEKISPDTYYVGAGYSFSLLGTQTARQGLSGLEFASGIPGSVGGAVYMNAGANGHETCETLVSVEFMHEDGQMHLYSKDQLHFSYRTSAFQTMKGAIVGATFKLVPSPSARPKQLEIIAYRKNTQPYSDMSAGCIFRNPSCGHAGALIDQSGLKGMRIGGAEVSELHANFIVNKGNASCEDVLKLIETIVHIVKERTGIALESEVRLIPFEG